MEIRMMERQFTNINLIGKLVKLDNIRKVKLYGDNI